MSRMGWLVIAAVFALVATAASREGVPRFVPGLEPAAWPTADGVVGNHYSPLADITPENVGHLEVAWTYRTGDVHGHEDGKAGTAFEATPIMVDGVLYVSTPYSRAIALDAETGAALWAFDPELDRTDRLHSMVTSRGLSHWTDPERAAPDECASRIFLAAYDGRLFSLDAATGMPCSDFAGGGSVDLGEGVARIEGCRAQYTQTAPPAVVNRLVVVGSSIFDSHFADAPSGVVRAFDARTGAVRWSWEPLPGVGAAAQDGDWTPAGAANTWATITADAERDLVFVPTGSPSPDHFGGLRPGDNGFANSLVALRASTGEVVWHFQMVHHDLWDYDLPSPPALIELERDGVLIPAVVQATKMGYLFVFHRETGEPLFPIVEQPVPASDVPGELVSPTQPMLVLPRPLAPQGLGPEDAWGLTPFDRAACRSRIDALRSDGVYAPPSIRGTIAYPGFIGGMEWGGVAFDPRSGLLVTNTNRVAMVATLIPREVADTAAPATDGKSSLAGQAGTPYAVRREPLLSPLGIPCSPPPWGMLHAVDMRTGELAWEVPLGRLTDLTKVPTPMRWGSPNMGGPLVTGGLIFIAATMDRRLRAFDLATGEVVWTGKLPASAQASPLTYRARPGGRQFVVIAAGGHDGIRSSLGDHLIAFALPAPEALGAREAAR
ncbi:MAG: pyrroloquinoline quinone-dependent dehydrogenase [Gemmatimonadetes bacterium]|nr:pyrroloquinoline quinone-dependent dehydrogenase [Gemmatimonadota bacterium]